MSSLSPCLDVVEEPFLGFPILSGTKGKEDLIQSGIRLSDTTSSASFLHMKHSRVTSFYSEMDKYENENKKNGKSDINESNLEYVRYG